ncbi:hypothetical protein M413DRAFT_443788 [Hebeloma cylindrosporum]|uniref:Ribosomal protein L1 n=1 Tax=Hebeloma cylindrosporum TaxID=76867 RepID=A0A0C2XZB9_HEBCY|nr:hypothetical protein M413DRAFT_443788 [Hebeloma cylindrosporum h7]
MAKDELIDSRVSLTQVRKAVEALHSHELKKKEKYEEGQLLPAKEQNLWLNVTVKAIPSGHKVKPVKIPIVHPLVDPRTSPVCLITKDPQREYKDLLETHNIKFISRVVGIEKLKGKFKPFEARRMLLKENGMFLADDRVIPLLPKLLGAKWFEAKKQPIPVCLTRKDLKGELERAISSTYMNQNKGTCTSIKVGKMSQNASQIVENIKTALPAIANAIKGNWDNIQSLNIKTNSSASLPIWSCTLDDTEGGRWNGPRAASDDEEEGLEVDGEESDVEEAKPKKGPTSKGRKRSSSSDEEEEEEEKPKKKAKTTAISSKPKTPSISKSSKLASAEIDSPTKKRKVTERSLTPLKAPSAIEPSISSGKKAQKGKSTSTATAEVTSSKSGSAPKSSATSDSIEKQKKSSVSSKPAPTTVDAPLKKRKTADPPVPTKKSGPSPSIADTITPSAGKDKAGKEKKKISKIPEAATPPAAPEKGTKQSLTKEELKQKRASGTGEKKKEIISKAKGGRSAKNAVLGKKVSQV